MWSMTLFGKMGDWKNAVIPLFLMTRKSQTSLEKEYALHAKQEILKMEEKDEKVKYRKRVGWENPWEYVSRSDVDVTRKKGMTRCQKCIRFKLWWCFFRRGPKRCLKLIIFFIIFYSAVILLFSICLNIYLHAILDSSKPRSTSLLSQGRGLSFYPAGGTKTEASVKGDEEVKKLLAKYEKGGGVDCSNGTAPKGKSCKFDISQLGDCQNTNGTNQTLCMYFKPTRIFDWKPEPYGAKDDLPDDMPKKLKQKIKSLKKKEELNMVWFSCERSKVQGAKKGTKVDDLKYFPSQGIPTYYFPYKGQKDYQDPMIAIQTGLSAGMTAVMKCQMWAKNIDSSSAGNMVSTLNVTK